MWNTSVKSCPPYIETPDRSDLNVRHFTGQQKNTNNFTTVRDADKACVFGLEQSFCLPETSGAAPREGYVGGFSTAIRVYWPDIDAADQ